MRLLILALLNLKLHPPTPTPTPTPTPEPEPSPTPTPTPIPPPDLGPRLVWDTPRLLLQDGTSLARQKQVQVSASQLKGIAFDFNNLGEAIEEPVQTCVLVPAGIRFGSAQLPLRDTIQVVIDGSPIFAFTARLLPPGDPVPPACLGQNLNGAVLVTLPRIPAAARGSITFQVSVE